MRERARPPYFSRAKPARNFRAAKPGIQLDSSPILSRLRHSRSRLRYQNKSTRARNPASYAGYHLSGHWMYWLFMNYLVFWTVSRMKKLREFVQQNAKPYLESLRLSEQKSNTLTGFQLKFWDWYELLLRVDRHRSPADYDFFLSVETSRFPSMPRHADNFLNNKAKIITEITWHFWTRFTVLKTIGWVFPWKF